jgi:hypothetical protein
MIEREGDFDIEKKNMRLILNVGSINVYTIVSVVQIMNQAGYMILHVALIVTLDRIEVALSMGLGTTRKNMQKRVLPITMAFLFQVMTATQ